MAGFPIIAAPSASLEVVLAKLDPIPDYAPAIVREIWAAGVEVGVDSVGLVAQSLHETGRWGYAGLVKLAFCNTAGMKVRNPSVVRSILGLPVDGPDHPLEHQMFQSWRMGALAHAWHARRYAGETRAPNPNPDPRWDWVDMSRPAVTWRELSGRWAVPGEGYGERIEQLMIQLGSTP